MYLKRIKLVNFRNYQQQEIELSPNMNLFFGENAQGKTNILEAVFLCAIGKSFRAKKEKELINLEKKQAFVEIEYEKSDRSGKIKIILDDKKTIFLNDIKTKQTE